jgi:activating signal cointegrator complex subunit 1
MLIVRIDVEKANEEMRDRVLQLVPTYATLATTSKIHLIQSIVSRLLVESVFQEYFIGLPKEHADDLSKVEKYLNEFGEVFWNCLKHSSRIAD